MNTKQERIRFGNKVEHGVSLQLEYRGFSTFHPCKAISADGMNDADEYSDTYDFLFYKQSRGVRGGMVKSFRDLNAFSVSMKEGALIPDLLDSNGMQQVCLDPVKKWKDQTDELWWEQRTWFVCDRDLTFALVFSGKDRESWVTEEKQFTNDHKPQPWHMARVTEQTKWIDLNKEFTHTSPADVNLMDFREQLMSFKI